MVYTVRQKCGQQLAIEAPVPTSCDTSDLIVAAVPESAIPAALGYSIQTKIPYVEVFCKNRYVGKLVSSQIAFTDSPIRSIVHSTLNETEKISGCKKVWSIGSKFHGKIHYID